MLYHLRILAIPLENENMSCFNLIFVGDHAIRMFLFKEAIFKHFNISLEKGKLFSEIGKYHPSVQKSTRTSNNYRSVSIP